PLEAPYFDEYKAFLREGTRGVSGYRRTFSTDRFSEQPDAEFPALQSYLRSLCEHSAQQGRVPVLKFCRSSGRVQWLRHAFADAMHVGVLRNPAS
ncbi:hypothetical protein, partial [Mesorhizobium sp. M8A.F.Ca.ET.181.01.1.1]